MATEGISPLALFIRLVNPVAEECAGSGRAPAEVAEYLLLVAVLLLLLLEPLEEEDETELFVAAVAEVLTDDKGMVPVGSNPLDLFRLASGHPDALCV